MIEVKSAKQWKSAVGQALVYSCEFPGKTPRVHLTGKVSTDFKAMVIKFCTQLGVKVTFES